jgi:hypothetical protein
MQRVWACAFANLLDASWLDFRNSALQAVFIHPLVESQMLSQRIKERGEPPDNRIFI